MFSLPRVSTRDVAIALLVFFLGSSMLFIAITALLALLQISEDRLEDESVMIAMATVAIGSTIVISCTVAFGILSRRAQRLAAIDQATSPAEPARPASG